MRKENCELCGKRARMYCESDQAKLCWDCDRKVHGANFLVARHTRILLCRFCQSSTPWKASGPNLTPTASLCQSCANVTAKFDRMNHELEHDDDDVVDDYDDDGDWISDTDSENYDDEKDDDEEEEGENQVVPWSTASSPPPDLAASSSSSEASSSLKRLRENSQLDSDDEVGCSSSTSMLRPLKRSKESPMLRNQRKAMLMAQPDMGEGAA